jgi:hypothetical protein
VQRVRLVLAGVSPLLAGLIEGALARQSITLEIVTAEADAIELRALAPGIVIVGPGRVRVPGAAALRAALPGTTVVEIAPDIRSLLGPGAGQRRPFSAAALMALVRRSGGSGPRI